MNDDATQVFTIIVLLFATAFALLPFFAFIIYVFYQNNKRKRIREALMNRLGQFATGNRWHPVRYASQQRFKSFFKIFPWEGAGILVITPGVLHFFIETNSGTPVELQFTPQNSRAAFLGKVPWPNGAISWIEFETPNGKHYFSSETGAFIIGSHKSTKAIYDEIAGT
ncbi:MAG TPA: hypothetical protein VK619_03065 [Pyrinomonadaceae bacterium]|nr:hypothetical protein [Pyrinomonadaceae bacterium]